MPVAAVLNRARLKEQTEGSSCRDVMKLRIGSPLSIKPKKGSVAEPVSFAKIAHSQLQNDLPQIVLFIDKVRQPRAMDSVRSKQFWKTQRDGSLITSDAD
jgi:hypothetical protein